MRVGQKITTFLWFDDQAEDAAKFYVSLFADSRIVEINRYGDAGPGPSGSIALNGGPHFRFTEAISLFVECDSQAEVDELWTKLTAGGGAPSQCGWLKDRFGLSWQIVPSVLMEMLRDTDGAKAKRATEAMLRMQKIDVARMRDAYEGR